MKQIALWFLYRRWLIKKASSQLSNERRKKLLAALTLNKMIPATGIIQSDAAFICLFHEPERLDRRQFMAGWRWANSVISGGSAGSSIVGSTAYDARRAGKYGSFDMGAELAVQQQINRMKYRANNQELVWDSRKI